MELPYIWFTVKLLLWMLVIVTAYYLYEFIVKPLCTRKKYSKYANVMIDPFVPVLGGIKYYIKNVEGGKASYAHLVTSADKFSKYDVYMEFEGKFPAFKILSEEAHIQFNKLSDGVNIDRGTEIYSVGKIATKGLFNIRSTENHALRKNTFVKLLGLNFASRYIPMIHETVDEIVSTWKAGSEYKSVLQMNKVTFMIFTKVLFGKSQVWLSAQKIQYEKSDGAFEELEMWDYFIKLLKDIINSWMHPLSAFFPILNALDLVNPFKRNLRNLNRFKKHIKNELLKLEDNESICKTILDKGEIDIDSLVEDIITFTLGGTETTAHLITSILFYLKKSPEKLDKLMKELADNGFKQFAKNDDKYDKDVILNMDYLNYVVKEGLRIDSPTGESLDYRAFKDITIWGIPIPAGSLIRTTFYVSHLNSADWQNPNEFIPERFDPESEFYSKLNSDKARGPYSFIPFGHGNRTCPGKTFAMLQAKVILISLLTRVDYSVPEETLQKEGIGFGMISEQDLTLTVLTTL